MDNIEFIHITFTKEEAKTLQEILTQCVKAVKEAYVNNQLSEEQMKKDLETLIVLNEKLEV